MSKYEQCYTPTQVGEIEIKVIPPAKVMKAQLDGPYFKRANDLFRILFKELNTNKLAMTIPVEANINNAEMRFYIASSDNGRVAKTTQPEASISSTQEHTVLSIGLRGSYSLKQYNSACLKLNHWLEHNHDWVKVGEAYAVYWNGPFTLPFLKRAEVHQPIQNVPDLSKENN